LSAPWPESPCTCSAPADSRMALSDCRGASDVELVDDLVWRAPDAEADSANLRLLA
jgi:hypothetical protein